MLEAGARSGVPTLYFHGTPSSARETDWLDRAARAHDVRIVAFDRAGYLGSERTERASLLSGAHDALAVADILGLGRFATVGFSGGAGYALTAAAVAPDRVTVAHLCGGLAAGSGGELPRARRLAFRGAAQMPWLLRPLLAGALRLNLRGLDKRLADPRAAARWFFEGPAKGAQIDAIDAYVEASDPSDLEAQLRDMARALRASHAVVSDIAAYGGDWPFDVSAVQAPVELWHGDADPAVPIGQARRLAASLPTATLHAFEGEGHFVIHSHGDEIAASIRRHAMARP